ncbi:hypothetical protein DWB68_08325 [Galactobacter valiniphilus]|uniref:Uncharacterized protein n=1 Tax=Galactobacter valiniphilus TaxID=2676122 RepID=A0A399JIG6_9MICC|nr:hypothetical protein DWB68_08325 [Galactobacter valiniphilus]
MDPQAKGTTATRSPLAPASRTARSPRRGDRLGPGGGPGGRGGGQGAPWGVISTRRVPAAHPAWLGSGGECPRPAQPTVVGQ